MAKLIEVVSFTTVGDIKRQGKQVAEVQPNPPGPPDKPDAYLLELDLGCTYVLNVVVRDERTGVELPYCMNALFVVVGANNPSIFFLLVDAIQPLVNGAMAVSSCIVLMIIAQRAHGPAQNPVSF
eukprot:gnl/Spiro4/24720_TR12281_c0_g2_i1.p5 gnl/Spiro4/24720_TR12281_c0_g2~~gnl/Spiro4/24720_TR12281_c0_g2_i1.p5  ORF type:complete len:125 (-),score=40.41 gnl/Spiro4/24720_TR12281_c0_g2_i1:78-452(-)